MIQIDPLKPFWVFALSRGDPKEEENLVLLLYSQTQNAAGILNRVEQAQAQWTGPEAGPREDFIVAALAPHGIFAIVGQPAGGYDLDARQYHAPFAEESEP